MEERGLHVIPLNFVVEQDFFVNDGCLWEFSGQLLQRFESHVSMRTAEDLLLRSIYSTLWD